MKQLICLGFSVLLLSQSTEILLYFVATFRKLDHFCDSADHQTFDFFDSLDVQLEVGLKIYDLDVQALFNSLDLVGTYSQEPTVKVVC